MIKIENTIVYGFEAAIRGMRNPLNSWEKSDSFQCDGIGCYFEDCPQYGYPVEWRGEGGCSTEGEYIVGKNDLALMNKLVAAGSDHSKFMRMINVTCDITAPMYWWKEADTYKVGTVRNSCSTMHTITTKAFTFDDFSHEHLTDDGLCVLENIIEALNDARDAYFEYDMSSETLQAGLTKEIIWWQIIQLLPSSYNQRATVQLNYAVLRNMYHSRKNHPLDEWHDFCHWTESLPYSKLITGGHGDEM